MPSNATKKTASALKPRSLFQATAAIMLAVALLCIASVFDQHSDMFRTVQIGQQRYKLQIADTAGLRARGLGGQRFLGTDGGMLFVYQSPAIQCFWMKDMQFPLDIMWLNSSRRIVHIEQNVAVSSYPRNYCPETAAQYVIELNAGRVRQDALHVGELLAGDIR